MEATVENEYLLGRFARRYHAYTYRYPAGITGDKQGFYGCCGSWRADRGVDRKMSGYFSGYLYKDNSLWRFL